MVTLAFFMASAAMAADQEQAKYSVGAEKDANTKRQAVLAEIKMLGDHEWAGEYDEGDGLGENVSVVIAPGSGYEFEWHGCLGVYDRNYGSVEWTGGRIHLSFAFENQKNGFRGIASEFIPVLWGSRRYLIPTDDFAGFCNSINEGQEPRDGSHGSYLLRRGDENKPVVGFPKVPAEYEQYLLTKPIVAAIVAVGSSTTRPSIVDWKFKDTPVTINAGAKQGLRVNMELVVTKPGDTVESVRVTKVEETRSEAVMVQIGEDASGPRVGWRLSTRLPWNVRRKK